MCQKYKQSVKHFNRNKWKCSSLCWSSSSMAWAEIINITNASLFQRNSCPSRGHQYYPSRFFWNVNKSKHRGKTLQLNWERECVCVCECNLEMIKPTNLPESEVCCTYSSIFLLISAASFRGGEESKKDLTSPLDVSSKDSKPFDASIEQTC